mmetsp:Transcript_1317/g.2940  ORF Transcript_1317/g.2940 Transcript_1317/m.2940 type:complete len:233 (-) Transcript_1317:159-857(-)
MVVPAWPPMTSTFIDPTSLPSFCATKVFARVTSNVVTPINRFGLYTPCFLSTSAQMGTMEFTGLEMMSIMASGQFFAQAAASPALIDALILNRSSLVIPGFRGTPAGTTTMLQSFRAASLSLNPPVTWQCELTCEMSTATPGTTGATSRSASSSMLGSSFIRSDKLCPIPPAAPATAALVAKFRWWDGTEESRCDTREVPRFKACRAANIFLKQRVVGSGVLPMLFYQSDTV